ncbi:hypothetical protein [Kitasatospora griseola]|uniref:hypothetical protein n=1 Tax=Kitasatospora griseola TaxID=2064 RepID=UPI0038181BAC
MQASCLQQLDRLPGDLSGAAGTFKGTFGHHPLGTWAANTRECVAMLLRPGNAAATIVADLDAWTRLLLLSHEPELATAEPATIRTKLYHLPARLTAHARRRTHHLDHSWPWVTAFTAAWRHATELPALT